MECAVLWLGAPRPPVAWTRRLAASGIPLVEVTELATAPALLRAMNPGVVLLAPGLDVRAQLLEAVGGETPARLVAVVRDPGDAMVALASGAHDALPLSAGDEELGLRIGAWARAAERERHHSGALAAVASRILELETRLQEVEHERDRLRELAHRDELTSLGNRRSFRSQVDYALTWADRYGGMVTVVVADLDGMKQLNDTCGHAAGDAALRLVAQVIRGSLRGVDHAARLGGDEFGIVTPRTSAVDAARVAERIRRGIEDLPLPGRLRLSASFGVASRTLPKGVGFAAEELIARADQALYAAKRAGKNRVVIDEASAQAAA
jgi:diguanylate cyclase (GGDEF)-like protein